MIHFTAPNASVHGEQGPDQTAQMHSLSWALRPHMTKYTFLHSMTPKKSDIHCQKTNNAPEGILAES